MRLAGRNRKGRRNAEDGGAGIAQRPIQVGKAQVVADGEAHQPERRLDSDAPCPARIGDGFTPALAGRKVRSEEHTSELQSLMRISYAVFCLKKKKKNKR